LLVESFYKKHNKKFYKKHNKKFYKITIYKKHKKMMININPNNDPKIQAIMDSQKAYSPEEERNRARKALLGKKDKPRKGYEWDYSEMLLEVPVNTLKCDFFKFKEASDFRKVDFFDDRLEPRRASIFGHRIEYRLLTGQEGTLRMDIDTNYVYDHQITTYATEIRQNAYDKVIARRKAKKEVRINLLKDSNERQAQKMELKQKEVEVEKERRAKEMDVELERIQTLKDNNERQAQKMELKRMELEAHTKEMEVEMEKVKVSNDTNEQKMELKKRQIDLKEKEKELARVEKELKEKEQNEKKEKERKEQNEKKEKERQAKNELQLKEKELNLQLKEEKIKNAQAASILREAKAKALLFKLNKKLKLTEDL
jgi:hypothetical protein